MIDILILKIESSMKPDKDKTQKLCLRQQAQICGVNVLSGGNRKWQNHYLGKTGVY